MLTKHHATTRDVSTILNEVTTILNSHLAANIHIVLLSGPVDWSSAEGGNYQAGKGKSSKATSTAMH